MKLKVGDKFRVISKAGGQDFAKIGEILTICREYTPFGFIEDNKYHYYWQKDEIELVEIGEKLELTGFAKWHKKWIQKKEK